jgi:hypothetical protein
MFDPEKVERMTAYDDDMNCPEPTLQGVGLYVLASDYNQLLALYRELGKHVVCGLCNASIWLVSVDPAEWSHYGNEEDGSCDHCAVPA